MSSLAISLKEMAVSHCIVYYKTQYYLNSIFLIYFLFILYLYRLIQKLSSTRYKTA